MKVFALTLLATLSLVLGIILCNTDNCRTLELSESSAIQGAGPSRWKCFADPQCFETEITCSNWEGEEETCEDEDTEEKEQVTAPGYDICTSGNTNNMFCNELNPNPNYPDGFTCLKMWDCRFDDITGECIRVVSVLSPRVITVPQACNAY